MSTAPPAPQADRKGQAGPLHGPWPAVTEGQRRWPGPGRPATPATLIALLAAAAIGAFSVPLDRAGVGWFITVIAGTTALVVAAAAPDEEGIPPLVRRSGPALPRTGSSGPPPRSRCSRSARSGPRTGSSRSAC